ncbi:sugar phosphate isomerase/epimerase [candidate division KSB1 bacterium]|nr:sugar phosphate isomerase/epimerase [candidate division KSB1 bacterium]
MSLKENFTRRDFVKAGAGSLAATWLVGCSGEGKKQEEKKKVIPVGVQLYSVRKDCEQDLPGTLAKVAEIGYKGVEFAGYYNYSAEELKKMLDDNGLLCCGTHTQLPTIMDDELAKTVEFNKILGNKFLIVPWIPEEQRQTKDDWLKLAQLFSEIAANVKEDGMYVGYHNHNFEWLPLEGGEIPWDVFFENASKDVVMQLDTGNGASGGADPVAVLKKYQDRALTVHLKEYSESNPDALIGEGDTDWAKIFEICESGVTEWYIVEEEKDVIPPIEGIQRSLENYQKLRAV